MTFGMGALLGACGLFAACGEAVTVAPVTQPAPAVFAIAGHTFRLVVDRTDAHFAALPDRVTLTGKSALSSSDPWKVLRADPPAGDGADDLSIWREEPDASVILSWPDIDTGITLTVRPYSPGLWIGDATFHDFDGTATTSATTARLELQTP